MSYSGKPANKVEAENVNLREICSSCAKPKRKIRKGSLTGWIFKANCCECEIDSEQEPVLLGKGLKEAHADREELPDFPDLGERYRVEEYIGQGGMGTVFKARDLELDQLFAVKVLRKELVEDKESLKRFELEARTVIELDHPNIVSVYRQDKNPDGIPFLVMDLVEGYSLSQIASPQMSKEQAIEVCMQICNALEYAHEKGVIHRDLKPCNVLVTRNGGSEIVKLVDFGIARVESSLHRETMNLTQTGDIIGSPHYMSPEQCLGFGLDQRSDVYSIGCILYELLIGSPPFRGANPVEIISKHLSHDDINLDESVYLGKRDAQYLAAVINKCLDRELDSRYSSASRLRSDLALVLSGKRPEALDREMHIRGHLDSGSVVTILVAVLFSILFLYSTVPGTLAPLAAILAASLAGVFAYVGYPGNRLLSDSLLIRNKWSLMLKTFYSFVFSVTCLFGCILCIVKIGTDSPGSGNSLIYVFVSLLAVSTIIFLSDALLNKKWKLLGACALWWLANSLTVGLYAAVAAGHFNNPNPAYGAVILAAAGIMSSLVSLPFLFGLMRLALKVSPSGLKKFLRFIGLMELNEFVDLPAAASMSTAKP